MNKRRITAACAILLAVTVMTGCSQDAVSDFSATENENTAVTEISTGPAETAEPSVTDENVPEETKIDAKKNTSGETPDISGSGETVTAVTNTTNLFTERDLTLTPDLSEAVVINVSDNSGYTVTEKGVYYLTGTASDFTVTVDADKNDKVQIVMENANISNESFPVIYVKSADKCFISPLGENTFTVNGSFTADGDTNTDAVIYSKDDIVLNGTGILNIGSAQGNGISCKDDLKATGGTYNISSALDGIEVNDSISVCGGEFSIKSNKDAIQCKNSDDDTLGSVYIENGTFNLAAESDGIQATSSMIIDGGTFKIKSSEGLESTYIQINGGDIDIEASDDGINAARKSSACSVLAEFNGGNIKIVMGAGDTDGVDSNGDIVVNGGTIDVTGGSTFDYDGTAQHNGGTVIVNGTEVDTIPQSMMGGHGGGRGGREFGGESFGDGPVPDGDFGHGGFPDGGSGERPPFDRENFEGRPFGEKPNFDSEAF